jgi:hypothetical protein
MLEVPETQKVQALLEIPVLLAHPVTKAPNQHKRIVQLLLFATMIKIVMVVDVWDSSMANAIATLVSTF